MKKNLSKGYLEYIQSPKWKKKRLMALIHYGEKCDKCGANKRLDVHHLTYERFGKELLADLQILCRKCHDAVHAIKDHVKGIQKPKKSKKKKKKVKFKPTRKTPIQVFNQKHHANEKVRHKRNKAAQMRKVPRGSTIVLQIRNPGSVHDLPARLRK